MSKKKERRKVVEDFWTKETPREVDVIDRGDHLKVTSHSSDAAAWWLGTLRAVYPQDHYSGEGDNIKMHPEMGVTLQLSRADGTLRIKGKKHLEWFKANFDHILESGTSGGSHGGSHAGHGGSGGLGSAPQSPTPQVTALSRAVDDLLHLDDDYSLHELLHHLPPNGAFKHGPTYVYRLWRGLLDQWIGQGGDIYVASPLLDARRLADIILLLIKHRLSGSRVHVLTMARCDPDVKYSKVYKEAKQMIKDIRLPGTKCKKRLITDERLTVACQRLDARFGRFHCKLIAHCNSDVGELMVTSASFHKFHFHYESGDLVIFFRMHVADLMTNYISPLGMTLTMGGPTPSMTPSATPSVTPCLTPGATTPTPTPVRTPSTLSAAGEFPHGSSESPWVRSPNASPPSDGRETTI